MHHFPDVAARAQKSVLSALVNEKMHGITNCSSPSIERVATTFQQLISTVFQSSPTWWIWINQYQPGVYFL